MKEDSTNQQVAIEKLELPKISWRSDFWLAVIPFIIGLIPLIFPDLTSAEWYKSYRIQVGVVFLLSPVFIPVILWMVRVIRVSAKRISQFPSLFDKYTSQEGELKQVKQNIYDFVIKTSNQKVFEISSATYQRNKLYMTILKEGPKLNKGDMVVVIDTEDGMIKGFFEIIQINKTDYLAEARSGIDSIWLGYVIQQGSMNVFPYFSAVYIPQGGQND